MKTLTLNCPVYNSYRVQQIAGMFDVPLSQKLQTVIEYEMPPVDDTNWNIGCIVGPSGSGKTTIAQNVFGNQTLAEPPTEVGGRDPDQAVIDGFGDCNIKDIVSVLTLVGFSSPPGWLKPYSVLSNGEQFRCNLARALLRGYNSPPSEGCPTGGVVEPPSRLVIQPDHPLPPPKEGNRTVVFDEYTSVVDRNVAKIASAAIAKAIKSGKLNCRFVAVTCHYDILDWLEPDWVLDTATGQCSRRSLRRPNIELELFRCERSLWKQFKTHHYLSGTLSTSCRCYAALWQGKPVAFCALIPQQGFERWYRVSRIVTLPDYQGVGIGSRFLDLLAELYVGQDYRFSITASHPSIISHCKRSEYWKAINIQKMGSQHSRGRGIVSFERRGR